MKAYLPNYSETASLISFNVYISSFTFSVSLCLNVCEVTECRLDDSDNRTWMGSTGKTSSYTKIQASQNYVVISKFIRQCVRQVSSDLLPVNFHCGQLGIMCRCVNASCHQFPKQLWNFHVSLKLHFSRSEELIPTNDVIYIQLAFLTPLNWYTTRTLGITSWY